MGQVDLVTEGKFILNKDEVIKKLTQITTNQFFTNQYGTKFQHSHALCLKVTTIEHTVQKRLQTTVAQLI